MADEQKPKKGLMSKLSSLTKTATQLLLSEVDSSPRHTPQMTFDADYVSMGMMLSSSGRPVRSRTEIYSKWHYMTQDGLISTILRLHVQMALGGHETTGETIFLEAKPTATPAEKKIIEELQAVGAYLNKVAHGVCFNACGFGDAYARVYVQKGVGLTHIDTESLFPPLVQPYEIMGRTVGYVISLGEKMQSRFDHLSVIRMKMPRMVFVPQMRALENSQQINLEAKSAKEMVPLPALAGGSFLDAAEEDYDNLIASLRGMVGQRIMASIDETMIGANLSDMTIAQKEDFMSSLRGMLLEMKNRAEEAVKNGVYATSRNFHIMPTFNEKQLTQISSFEAGANSGVGANIEDVMFNARKLSGTMGIDLSMVGFADQLTGGLGEGGFNRTSSQGAERSRIIRTALTAFCNDALDRHMLAKYGFVWADSERPYAVNFFSANAALEAENQASRERATTTGSILVQVMDGMRNMGLPEEACEHVLVKHMAIDADSAKILAKGVKEAKPPQPEMPGDTEPVEPITPERVNNTEEEDA